jgi:putative transposase
MIEICRDHAANARALAGRPDGAGLDRRRQGEARKQFRPVNGHLHLPALRATLDATIPAVTPAKEDAA